MDNNPEIRGGNAYESDLAARADATEKTVKPVPLKNVHVASPCPLRWEQMIGNERVRHCAECNLNVYNLSALTAREAEELIASREGRFCVRFYQRPDGTVLTQDCPVGFRAVVRRFSRTAGTAVSALLSVGSVAAQTTSMNQLPAATHCDSDWTPQDFRQTGISFTVVDPVGAEIPGAHVTVQKRNKHGKVRLTGTTNNEGRVLILVPSGGSYTISIESGGFKPYKNTFSVDENKMTACRIALRLNPSKMVILGELVESPITSSISAGTATFSGRSVPPQIGSRPYVAPMHR